MLQINYILRSFTKLNVVTTTNKNYLFIKMQRATSSAHTCCFVRRLHTFPVSPGIRLLHFYNLHVMFMENNYSCHLFWCQCTILCFAIYQSLIYLSLSWTKCSCSLRLGKIIPHFTLSNIRLKVNGDLKE